MRFRVDFNDVEAGNRIVALLDDWIDLFSDLALFEGAEVELSDGAGHQCLASVVSVTPETSTSPGLVELALDWGTWRTASRAYETQLTFGLARWDPQSEAA